MQSGSPGASGVVLDKAIEAHLAGRIGEAQKLYQSVIDADPADPVALHLLGVSYIQQGQPLQGISFVEQALALRPDDAGMHYNLACALQALNRLDEAIEHYETGLAINPRQAEAHLNLGNALQAQDRHAEAIAHYQETLALKPDDADAHNNWGNSLQALERQVEARDHYEKALAFKPDHAQARNNLGNTLQALNRHEEAIARFREALAIKPEFAEAHNNLGHALQALNRPEEAIGHYEAALVLRPDYAEAHSNWGIALQALNRHEEAIARYDRAIALKPDYAEAHWNKSLALLCLGRFAAGWQLYEKRWQRKQTVALPDFNLPLWLGQEGRAGPVLRHARLGGDRASRNMVSRRSGFVHFIGSLRALLRHGSAGAGRNILIQFEQGHGDALQMLRYVALLERIGMRCWIQVPPALMALTHRSFPRAQVVGVGQCPPDVRFRVPMLSLPLAMKTFSEAQIPGVVPYLIADERKKAEWASRLAIEHRRSVGLAWRGRPTHRNDRNRSILLETLVPLFSRKEIQFVNLQKDLTEAEFEELARHDNVTIIDKELDSFDDTAAVASVLDLVICVDSAPAHLSGALGKTTWVLLPFSPDWRWLLARSDCPWYPSARLFRQKSIGDWAEVVRAVGGALSIKSLS